MVNCLIGYNDIRKGQALSTNCVSDVPSELYLSMDCLQIHRQNYAGSNSVTLTFPLLEPG